MNVLQFALGICMAATVAMQPAAAHEMGTSALVLHETAKGSGQLVFKRTVSADGNVPPVDFQFQPACELRDLSTEWEDNTEVIQRGSFYCNAPLNTHTITATGFTRLAPELIVLARPLNAERVHAVLTPQQANVELSGAATKTPTLEYLAIGIEHILFGWDHVLFVTGLYLVWKRRKQSVKQLVGQFTLFTLGHSLTLGALVLGYLVVPTRAIEALIALSVLWLAWQLIEEKKLSTSTWPNLLLIVAFGLLHGSGFALSMEERGFPEEALASTLLLFNAGIEIGQLWIVTLLATAFAILEKAHYPNYTRVASSILTLLIGGTALYWTVERIHSYV